MVLPINYCCCTAIGLLLDLPLLWTAIGLADFNSATNMQFTRQRRREVKHWLGSGLWEPGHRDGDAEEGGDAKPRALVLGVGCGGRECL